MSMRQREKERVWGCVWEVFCSHLITVVNLPPLVV